MSKIKLQATDGNGGTISLKGPTTTDGNAEFELTLPANDGSADQFLKTNGSGALSWDTPSGGAALTGSTNNTVCTVTGANAIAGEANLTFDGSDLAVTSGKLIVGATGTTGETWTQNALIVGTETLALGRAEANNAGPHLHFYKSRNGTWGSNTIVQDNDQLGSIIWYADDGTDYKSPAAMIQACSDGTPGTNDMPGRLIFYTTPDGSETNTERLRIDSTGDVKVTDGNLVIGTSGHGIDFSATADAGGGSSNRSELLDDYEEGQWAPSYTDGSSYVDFAAHWYVKVGAMVTVFGNIRTVSSGTTGTAGFYLTGLPFTSANVANLHFSGTIIGDNGWDEDLSDSNLVCQVYSNQSLLRFWKNSGQSVGNITLNNIGNSANLMYSISYLAA